MSRKKTERKYSSCLFGLYLYRSQLYIFPKFCCTSLFGWDALSEQISHSHGIGCQMERVWIVSSCRRASSHTCAGLSLQPLSHWADGSRRALQLSEASVRQCSPNWKKVRGGNPWYGRQCSTGVQVLESDRGYTPVLLFTTCEVMR